MATGLTLFEKIFEDARKTGASYVALTVTKDNVAYTSDGGCRKSTKNFRQSEKEIAIFEKQLKTLNERNIVFSENIKKVMFRLSDGREALFERKDNVPYVLIKAKKVTEANIKEYEFIRFVSSKEANVGIAFAIGKTKKDRREIIACSGSIMNGIISTGIDTDLMFLMNGPVKVHDGEFDSKYDKENELIFSELAQVLKKAIMQIPLLKISLRSMYAVLPCSMDDESTINMELRKATAEACNEYHVFRNRVGTIVGKNRIIMGSSEVTTLFPQELYEKVFGDGKYWLEDIPSGSREEYFLIDIGVTYYDREKFLCDLFDESCFDGLMEVLSSQKDKWLRDFYIFCALPTQEEITRKRLVSGFKNLKSIRDSKGKMRYPYETSIVSSDKNISRNSVVIKECLLCPGGQTDDYTEMLRQFFANEIGIGTFSQKPEIEQLVKDMATKKQPIDDKYCEKLMKLVRYDNDNHSEIDFSEYSIFPYEGARGLSRAKAVEIVIGKPYVKEGALLSSAMDRPQLWKGLKKLLNDDDLGQLILFAERNGAVGMPKVIKQAAMLHPNFSKELFADGKHTNRDSDFDFCIPGLDEILKRRSLQLSKLVWRAINDVSDPAEVLYAEYSCDNRRIVNRCDSSLIQILRQRTWIPDKDNKLHMPRDIAVTDISDDFIYNRKNPILKQLGFGSEIKKREQERKNLEKMASTFGFVLVSQDEYREFLKWKGKSE